MALHKIHDVDSNYRFSEHDIMGFNIYSNNEVIGSVDDILVDDEGRFRYVVMFIGRFLTGKRVLLPVGATEISYRDRCLFAHDLSHDQINRLPEYDRKNFNYDYETQIRGIFRPAQIGTGTRAEMSAGPIGETSTVVGADRSMTAAESMAAADMSPAVHTDMSTGSIADINADNMEAAMPPVSDRTAMGDADLDPTSAIDSRRYDYGQDSTLYDLNEQNHNTLKLYEERLVADKSRQKTGEVGIGKRVETETAQVSVPIEKERVVIESIPPTDTEPVTPGEDSFKQGEVTRMEIYEETPDIQKAAFLREEVTVRKEVDRDVVNAEDEVRREEIDIKSEGHPVIEQSSSALTDDRV